jgi:hypothetical protein
MSSATTKPRPRRRKTEAVVEEATAENTARCYNCHEAAAPKSKEGLCWVCRRLKLSAWRDSDLQASVIE